jgi:hypothetical protein
MPTTAKELCDCCWSDEIPSCPVLTDYFGHASTSGDEEDITIVFGVYQGMVKSGVSAELLHNCLLSDRLNELVHAKHKHRTGYYDRAFYYKMLGLPDQHPLGPIPYEQLMPIYSDDHCPSCNANGYLTLDQYVHLDGLKMLMMIMEYIGDASCA